MLSTLLIVMPVFALIFVGWLVRKLGLLGPLAAGEINRFVVYLALPALLFDVISRAKPVEIWQPGFIATFGLSCLLVFAVTLACRWRSPNSLPDAAIDALSAAYANTGFLGFPLALAIFGPSALTPTLIAALLTVCGVFAVAIIVIEIGLQTERRIGPLLLKVAASLGKNPLLLAPVIGAFFPVTGMIVPDPVSHFVKLLGGAASPCALVGLGLFLAEKRAASRSELAPAAFLISLKLLLQPLTAWLLATQIFRLSDALTHQVVMLAALPTGTGPYMLAEFYQREASLTSKVIIGSTVLSVLTITVYVTYGLR